MLNGILGATLMVSGVLAFAGLAASPAQAQCNNGVYYSARPAYGTCYQPRVVYSSSTYCAPRPTVCYDTPRYRSRSTCVNSAGHYHDRARYQRWRRNCR